jgi:hypothetical protein
MPASLVEPLVNRLLHLDSTAIVIIVRGIYNILGDHIKTHQACRVPGTMSRCPNPLAIRYGRPYRLVKGV